MSDNLLASDRAETGVSTTTVPTTAQDAAPVETPEALAAGQGSGRASVKRPGDRVFEGLSTTSAVIITVMIALIGLFLILRAIPAIQVNEGGLWGFLTYGGSWDTAVTTAMAFGIPTFLATTILISVLALIIAMPVALGIAIFLSNYAPARLVKPLGYLVDMLAAVPSIVYGLWGWQVLGPKLGVMYEWLNSKFGGFFLFATFENSPSFGTGRNIFTGGVVLAVMILPIIAATAREVFVQTPRGQIESALALGATRWEVVRMTVLPFGMSGYISGSMLGLGRALGETMALYMVVSPLTDFRFTLFDGGTTFATAIALAAAEFGNEIRAGAYIAAGLVLFLLTFVVNAIARSIIKNK